jgi:hypothetical protein
MIWCVLWVVLMIFWAVGGAYVNRAADRTVIVGGTLIPWLCVLILGLIIFGAVSPGPVRF